MNRFALALVALLARDPARSLAEMIGDELPDADLETERREFTRALQDALAVIGLWDNDADGMWSPALDEAVREAHAMVGTTPGAVPGQKFIGLLAAMADRDAPVVGEPEWLTVARSYLGEHEVNGPHHNPRIVQWWRDVGATWFTDDETPWCGAFVGGVLYEAGLEILPGSKAPRARAWEKWGRPLAGPALGCVITFWRGTPSSGSGHVGFVTGRDKNGRLMVLGGNQRNAVTIAPFDRGRHTSYRWPTGRPLPEIGFSTLPLLDNSGAPASENEA